MDSVALRVEVNLVAIAGLLMIWVPFVVFVFYLKFSLGIDVS